MGFFLILSVIVIGALLIWSWIKLVNWMIPRKKEANLDNPYIHSHLMRRANDEAYSDYLDWLDKTGGDLPIEKIKTKEELKFERKLKNS